MIWKMDKFSEKMLKTFTFLGHISKTMSTVCFNVQDAGKQVCLSCGLAETNALESCSGLVMRRAWHRVTRAH